MVALLIDGVHFGEHVVPAAVGVDEHGDKHVLGCARANRERCGGMALLADLVERGFATKRGLLSMIDGPNRCIRRLTACLNVERRFFEG